MSEDPLVLRRKALYEWARGDAVLLSARLAKAEERLEQLEPTDECRGAHDTGEMLWPGTAHQGVVCRRCKRFLPC